MISVNTLLRSGKFGTFKLSKRFIDKLDIEVYTRAFEGMIVTRCEYRYDLECFEYVAYHPTFEIVEAGFEPNDYFLQVNHEMSNFSDYTYFKWVKR